MRAIAALSVLLVHVAGASGAADPSLSGRLLAHLNVGVTIFFVISGFLLYRPFIAERGGGAAPPRVASFAKRRVLRIYPAYWLALTALTIVPGVTGVYDGQWLSQYALVHTLPIGNGRLRSSFVCDLSQTWSLAVEATFYAILPLFALLVARLLRGHSLTAWMRAQLVLLAALSVVSVVLYFSPRVPTAASWVGGTVIGWVYWFALGMGLAVISVRFERAERQPVALRLIASRPLIPWIGAFAAYLSLSLWLAANPFLFGKDQQVVTHLTFGLIALLLMLPAVFGSGEGGLPRRFLAHPVVAWLGLISYGIFLWHFVFAVKLGGPGGSA